MPSIRNLITSPPRSPLVAPSILSADFGHMAADCSFMLDTAEGGGADADLLHVDVMDGHFAPNLTMGPDMVRGVRRTLPGAFCDVHLMVMDPERFFEPFAAAGAGHCTFHIERASGTDAKRLAGVIRGLGMTAGLAINPATPVGPVLDVVGEFDLILVMSVVPGFSGQSFMPESLGKVRAIKPRLRADQRLEIDGGIGPANITEVLAAGVDIVVAATAIFGKPQAERRAAVRLLRGV